MKKILIVDDESVVREVCEHILARCFEDVIIDHASNGLEALEKTSSGDYSVIICDLDMPVMGGIPFYEKLKLDLPSVAQKVVFVSGYFDDQTVSFLDKEGRSYLSKPFVKKELINLLNSVLDL